MFAVLGNGLKLGRWYIEPLVAKVCDAVRPPFTRPMIGLLPVIMGSGDSLFETLERSPKSFCTEKNIHTRYDAI